MALPPGTRLGHYEITSPIGAGGMGEVYRAIDTTLKRAVAIKVLPEALAADAERLARLQRQAEVLASLNHPHIAQIYGLERTEGSTVLVLELVEGPTLADRIVEGPLPIEDALVIAKQIAEALEAAHEQGIVHRDLKPANVKLRPDGQAKVLDFGLAKLATRELSPAGPAGLTASPTLTIQASYLGVILGTAAYMSPEQAKGKIVDRRADIWAFGVVLCEMLSGRRMYDGETAAETLARIIEREPDLSVLPSTAPTAVRMVLERCLTKDPRARLQAIGEARILIERGIAQPVDVRRESPVRVERRRGLLAWTLAGLLAVALIAVVARWAPWRAVAAPALVRFFYTTPTQQIMVAAYRVNGGAFQRDPPRLWSKSRYLLRGGRRSFDVHPDGNRLVMAVAPEGRDSVKRETLVFVFNFLDELRRKVPVSRK
jgi:eukaryotic-like serine/threonine-protein kinase